MLSNCHIEWTLPQRIFASGHKANGVGEALLIMVSMKHKTQWKPKALRRFKRGEKRGKWNWRRPRGKYKMENSTSSN